LGLIFLFFKNIFKFKLNKTVVKKNKKETNLAEREEEAESRFAYTFP
jgi:hypothetical protein